MPSRDVAYLTVAQLGDLLRARKLSPVELLRALLDRIGERDRSLHAFIALTDKAAMEEARAAEQAVVSGAYLGPLHGVPVGIKDLFWAKGVATTAGSRILARYVPIEDATSVARLRSAGGVVVGKLNMHEFAFGITGTNPHYGTPSNPWGPDRLPGGSSSGSAVALAAGLLPAATGSDTGGSIRVPAALCGVVGLKPTYGRVSRYGAIPLAWSLDHVGPMARTVEDTAILLGAMAGHDSRDPTSSALPVPDYRAAMKQGVRGLRAGILYEWMAAVQPGVLRAVEAAVRVLEEMGIAVQQVSLPVLEEAAAVSTAVLGSEAAAFHRRWLREQPEAYSQEVLARLQANLQIPAVEYLRGQQGRRRLIQRVLGAMEPLDVLVAPMTPITAPRLGEVAVTIHGEERTTQALLTLFSRLFNITGLPAISVPCGFDEQGLPVGLQIAGKPFQEATVLRVAYAYEQATPWHSMRPTL
ncbi:MAG: amidase [Chloroflexi bacterium]|nr:amidase [Chloroflexota bacterium]